MREITSQPGVPDRLRKGQWYDNQNQPCEPPRCNGNPVKRVGAVYVDVGDHVCDLVKVDMTPTIHLDADFWWNYNKRQE